MRSHVPASALLVALLLLPASCGDPEPNAVTTTPEAPRATSLPCDPGGGFPTGKAGCPDPTPLTAWLERQPDGSLALHPFRTLGNDPEGRAYAREHDLEFPFSNDYYDAPSGPPTDLVLAPTSVCSGIIRVGYREPLADHAVDCDLLVDAAADRPLAVAVWHDGDSIFQVSELYRP